MAIGAKFEGTGLQLVEDLVRQEQPEQQQQQINWVRDWSEQLAAKLR